MNVLLYVLNYKYTKIVVSCHQTFTYVSDQHSNIMLAEDPGAFSHITKLTDGETTFLSQ
jgi:hypothetical protein